MAVKGGRGSIIKPLKKYGNLCSLYFLDGQFKLFTSFVETTVDTNIYAFNTYHPLPPTPYISTTEPQVKFTDAYEKKNLYSFKVDLVLFNAEFDMHLFHWNWFRFVYCINRYGIYSIEMDFVSFIAEFGMYFLLELTYLCGKRYEYIFSVAIKKSPVIQLLRWRGTRRTQMDPCYPL